MVLGFPRAKQALSVEHRSKFAALNRQWWRLQMSGTKNSTTKNTQNTRMHIFFFYTYFTIFSDSLSCLQSPHSINIDHPYILDILYNYYYVSNQGKIDNICWIPSHNGIHGNNEADKAAKSALEFEIVKFKIPSTDLKHFIKLFITLGPLWYK